MDPKPGALQCFTWSYLLTVLGPFFAAGHGFQAMLDQGINVWSLEIRKVLLQVGLGLAPLGCGMPGETHAIAWKCSSNPLYLRSQNEDSTSIFEACDLCETIWGKGWCMTLYNVFHMTNWVLSPAPFIWWVWCECGFWHDPPKGSDNPCALKVWFGRFFEITVLHIKDMLQQYLAHV